MIQVLMDIDETMVSVPPGINALSSKIMFKRVFGVDAHEEIINNVGKTEMGIIPEVLEKVGMKIKKVPVKAYTVWAQALKKELDIKPVRILPGIVELLKALSVLPNVRLRLLTGNSPWRAKEKLVSGHLEKFFLTANGTLDGVFGDMSDKREDLFHIIKNQARNNDKFVIIDDSLIGAVMGQKFSIPTILVATGKATEKDLMAYSNNVFPDFGENKWKKAVSLIKSF